jgi:N-acetylglucosaminyldiphosphoundecaprenol N-acetyl-beta-D-mannosaminyltransferase
MNRPRDQKRPGLTSCSTLGEPLRPPPETVRCLFGVTVHAVTMDEALNLAHEAIITRRQLSIGVVNVAKLVKLQKDREIRDSILCSNMVLADGAPVVWSSRLLRRPLPERVTGIDLFEHLLSRASKHRYGVYFLGATQEVLDAVVERAQREHPDLIVAGARHGYFDYEDLTDIAETVCATGADVLFVAMTTPKKEIFLREVSRRSVVPVTHGVGGSFDVYAGKTKRAPIWMQRTGLEWLYRVIQEPGRMWKRYLVTNTQFVWLLARNVIRPAPPFHEGKHDV